MKKTFFIFGLAFLFCSCEKPNHVKKNDVKPIADSAVLAYQKKLIAVQLDSVFSKTDFNASVGIFKDSIELYRRNQGFANFEDSSTINNQTVFSVASISKQFTAVLILQLVENGKLSLDDKASKYVKELQKKEYESITVHQLLNHSSGLNNFGEKLVFKSGTDFNYSNDGFNALGKIVENVSGKPFHESILALFKKAGLKNSSTGTTFEGQNFAQTYVGTLEKPQKIDNMPKRLGNKEIGIPAGGVLSTIDDLHAWNNALYNGKIIKTETLKKFLTKSSKRQHPVFGKMDYGYGIMMNTEKPLAYFHSGYVKGAPSLNIYYPETKTSVIILSNFADEEKGKNAAFKPHQEIKKVMDLLENIK